MSGTDLRELLDRTVAPVEDMPDVVPQVLAAGRSSVRRRRTAVSAFGAIAGVVATVGVAQVVGGPDDEVPFVGYPSATVAPSGSASDSPTVAPPATGTDTTAFRIFKLKMAAALDAALPGRLGTVRPEASVLVFTGISAQGRFPITFRLDPWPGRPGPTRCPVKGKPSDSDDAVVSCLEQRLPNGELATAFHELGTNGVAQLAYPRVETMVHDHWVQLYLFEYHGKPKVVPAITNAELIKVLANARVAELIRLWAAHPEWQDR